MRWMVVVAVIVGQAANASAQERYRAPVVSVVPSSPPDDEPVDQGRGLRVTGAVLMFVSAVPLAGAVYFLRRAQDLNDEYWSLGGIYAPDYASVDRAHEVREEGRRMTLYTWACGALTAALLGSGAIVYGVGMRSSGTALALHPSGVSLSLKF